MKKRSKFNSLTLGLALGLVVPVLSFTLLYFIRYDFLSFSEFLHVVIEKNIQVVSISIIPNVLIFFLFTGRGFLSSAKGILIATVIFTGLIFLMRFA